MSAPQRLVLGIWGLEKHGKSSFALSFPRPMEYFDFDFGIETLDYDEEGFHYHPFSWSPIGDLEEMEQVLDSFLVQYTQACHRLVGTGGTVVVDGSTQIDALIQAVLIGRVRELRARKEEKKVGKKPDPDEVDIHPFDHGTRNAKTQAIYREPLTLPKVNAVFIHKAKAVYDGKNRTSQFEFAGWNQVPGAVRAMIHLYKDDQGEFMGEIQSSVYQYHPALRVFAEPSYETLAGIFGVEA